MGKSRVFVINDIWERSYQGTGYGWRVSGGVIIFGDDTHFEHWVGRAGILNRYGALYHWKDISGRKLGI